MARRTATVFTEALPSSGERLSAQLVVVEGADANAYLSVSENEQTVGTSAGCDLVLSDPGVSARHLAVRADGANFVVRDLGSKNGTVYEGSVISSAKLRIGSTLKIGNSFLRLVPQLEPLELEPTQSRSFGELVGESLVSREVFAVLELAAASEVTILIEGETGTGKELAARAIHEASERRKGPFVAVDCGALPDTMLDSELFGHVRGAFTGAARDRQGAFVRASGGTLFLDELGGVPVPVQARLLRVLEERRVKALGSDKERDIDVRIVAASRHDLEREVDEGNFRPDLYYRLSVIRVALPPLRARKEDIAPIVGAMLRRRGCELGEVGGAHLERLIAHSWPGNVRELRNVIDRALALTPQAETFSDLRLSLAAHSTEVDSQVRSDLQFRDAKALVVRDFERRYLRDAFARCEGNISATARATGLERKHLRDLLRRHGIVESGES